MRVFSYIVMHDAGYAPNPFHGVCTLACCKPRIRRHAQAGDLIVGLTSKARGHRIVYVMRVAERLSFDQYWHDPRFRTKRPRMTSSRYRDQVGDNHYEPVGNGRYRQRPSGHSAADGSEDPQTMRRDLGPDRLNPVLIIGREVTYFGSAALPLPDDLAFLIASRGHRSAFTPRQIELVRQFVATLPAGVHAPPALWPLGDDSWRPEGGLDTRARIPSTRTRTPRCQARCRPLRSCTLRSQGK